ncbi:MAG: YdcH family protein, partial [Achromobacter sp.]
MFPEYRQLITQLKSENAHFSALFQRHNDLDQEIKNMEDGIVP